MSDHAGLFVLRDIRCVVHRQYRADRPAPWRVSAVLDIEARFDADNLGRYPTQCPAACAVVDDFGNLVLVTGWR